jgi:hypothetical protein
MQSIHMSSGNEKLTPRLHAEQTDAESHVIKLNGAIPCEADGQARLDRLTLEDLQPGEDGIEGIEVALNTVTPSEGRKVHKRRVAILVSHHVQLALNLL